MVSAVLVTGERQQLPDREEGDPPHLHHQEGRQGTLRSVQVSGHQHSGQGGGGDRTDRWVVTSHLPPLSSTDWCCRVTQSSSLPEWSLEQDERLAQTDLADWVLLHHHRVPTEIQENQGKLSWTKQEEGRPSSYFYIFLFRRTIVNSNLLIKRVTKKK